MLSGKTVAACTLGCKTNQYETDGMIEILKKMGASVVDFEDTADVYLINTCSVTNMADKKSRQMIHRARKNNPKALVIACGCYVQAEKEKLSQDKDIDIIISNNRKKDIGHVIAEYFNSGETACFTDISREKEFEELDVNKPVYHTRAYVKIQDGCNQFCTYCIIPYVRGRIRSRSMDSVIDEISRLAEAGVKEVVLTGIHISSYGRDMDGDTGLADLVENISKIEGIERIRLGSLEPGIITEEFAHRIKAVDKLCPHFHLSLQSGCDSVLRRMNRKYTCSEYMEKCELLRKVYKNPAITTDVIVGFPGETEEEFECTRKYLEDINLYEMHIFKYSQRKGTPAATMPNQVDPSVKNSRSDVLLAISEHNKHAYQDLFVGTTVKVLVEELVEKNGEEYMRGHTERYMDVHISTEGITDPQSFKNRIVEVMYEKTTAGEYVGKINRG
ncbi:tRNA (N(6)-L-threonylcarbamoyladenosine(37)-C(2))-methylthiotransferase MtaB [Coprococcus sp. OM04-5BH]|uniref:tRNA (N(6)-L-threonylcarbamoyladenosine(37)-C(2))- methylthiotransferase MtaB n=1 Tax=Coprococcus sp. OM04-5BH TaxID=2293093 RepID=UPI000E4CC6C8|nr:tRNA (N(6)-L-threonylcarbamoyladenosine(37)-C(2))-methylthiotransferase MtaB [Coprococcus sp. OM04-5BH]RHV31913.1 tRNA (N(6)-L-threonylcarbamoyladenosine(37)-C(2))-methylthiotransferase MtaB [Coprococcus sp. OM04-5BH]